MMARPSFGPVLLGPNRTSFRLWGPGCKAVDLVVEGGAPIAMRSVADGWYEVEADCGAGARYQFKVGDQLVPDPASHAQAGDINDPSIVVDPAAYVWRKPDWTGRPWHEAVIYELHVGAIGGFAAVTDLLPQLADLGVTVVELMPIADFPGKRNWGYDGVLTYAPDASYGTPDELRKLIDTAHELGLMVFLDVVYNHFGPDGNFLGLYAPQFYRHDRHTPWGDGINFAQPAVRRFFIENAAYWLGDFRFDGLRFDAVHAIEDSDFLLEMAKELRTRFAGRQIHLVLENEENDEKLLRPMIGAEGYDAQWADDLHHCVHVLITGEQEGYYENFSERPAELLARCLREGFAYQGEVAPHTGKPRGTPSGHLPPTCFVLCLQNHDQIGNRALGERLTELAHPQALQAATVLLLLSPQIPLLFMGQEWASTRPFLYFANFDGALAEAVTDGRRREFAAFAAFAHSEDRDRIPDPNHPDTFAASKPGAPDGPGHAAWLGFHRDLLQIRTREIMPRIPGCQPAFAEALGASGVRASWRMGDGAVLGIAVNFGEEPLSCPEMPGEILFENVPTMSDRLPGFSAVVRLQRAAA